MIDIILSSSRIGISLNKNNRDIVDISQIRKEVILERINNIFNVNFEGFEINGQLFDSSGGYLM